MKRAKSLFDKVCVISLQGIGAFENQFFKREAYAAELRKKGMAELINKKRAKCVSDIYGASEPALEATVLQQIAKTEDKVLSAVAMLSKPIENESLLYKLLEFIRRSITTDAQSDQLVKMGFVSRIAELLDHPSLRVRFEVAWILTNIAAGRSENCSALRSLDIPKKLLGLLESESSTPELKELYVWTLGNIAGDSPDSRNELFHLDISAKLINVLRMKEIPFSLLRVVCWTISALCKGPFKYVQVFVPCFRQLLEVADIHIISDTLWALTYITEDASDEIIQYITSKVPLKAILKNIADTNPMVKSPALRALGNICCGPFECTETIMTHTSLQLLLQELTTVDNENFLADLCWIVSNLALGPPSHIQKLLNAGIVKYMCRLIDGTAPYKVKIHAAYALSGASEEGTEKQIWTMVELGIVESLGQMLNLENANPEVLCATLQGLDNVMTAGQGGEDETNQIAARFEGAGGFDSIIRLTQHQNSVVAGKALKIMEKFYNDQKKEWGNYRY